MASDLADLALPEGVRSRQIDTAPTGLSYHILEAGYSPARDRPLILLLHGFPELAYSWRNVIPVLEKQGYYVVAPDQRGYGRTTGWDTRGFSDVDLSTFAPTNLVRDVVVLVNALGYSRVHCLVGHDFGAVPAAYTTLCRPDMVERLVLMSHPFAGVPAIPFNTANMTPGELSKTASPTAWEVTHSELSKLGLKHYQKYYSTAPAHSDMMNPAQGLHEFLKGYFHLKSASWKQNDPHTLDGVKASELAKMPHYYIMPADKTMPEAVADAMAATENASRLSSDSWFPDEEAAIYASEFGRTGFQGGLNWYRIFSEPEKYARDIDVYAGKKIDRPCWYGSGAKDWGTYQKPGSLEQMTEGRACSDFRGLLMVENAGHFLQQENPSATAEVILKVAKTG